MKKKGKADVIDVYVGKKLRELREEANYTQAALGELISVTFQQIQKYEQGKNRIAAGRLAEICHVLKVEIWEFFPPAFHPQQSGRTFQKRHESLVSEIDKHVSREKGFIEEQKKFRYKGDGHYETVE